MKKIPYGICNYRKLQEEGYVYVDKTMYLEKLEDVGSTLVYLRPGRFGKTLFTSMMYYYYDINSKDLFETLFKDTYVYKNPTKLKNKYYVLKLDFSNIETYNKDEFSLGNEFTDKVRDAITYFNNYYKVNFEIDSTLSSNMLIRKFILYFNSLNFQEKLYILIDEYDNFTNTILEGSGDRFKSLVGNEGIVKNFYSTIKEYVGLGIVDRVFITGICPITLDSMTTGFNIATDISRDIRFTTMIGLTHDEVKELTKEIDKEKRDNIYKLMLDNYDGYLFNKDQEFRSFNATLVMYFLKNYYDFNKIPDSLIDVNIASDYNKVGKMLNLCKGENRLEILRKTVQGEPIINKIVKKFNPAIEFTENDMISMLYYLGYLTISGELVGIPELTIPNKVMKEIYADYFMQMMDKEAEFRIDNNANQEILIQLAQEGRIDKIVEILKIYLNNLSNRDLIKFDEKYIKLIFYCIAMNIKAYSTKSEMEVNRNYPDILLVPRDSSKGYKAVMVEFKYIKKGEVAKLEDKQKEAKEQIERYSSFEDIKDIQGLRKYTIVVVTNDIYVEEIV